MKKRQFKPRGGTKLSKEHIERIKESDDLRAQNPNKSGPAKPKAKKSGDK